MDYGKCFAHVEKFKNSHKGLENTKFVVFDTQEEAFPKAPVEWHAQNTVSGAYYPASNVVVIIAKNIKDIKELNKTLKHEVFGHLALNRLTEDEKYELLSTISNASSDTWVGKYRDYLAMTGYSTFKNDPFMLAEEVVAHTAELSDKEIGYFKSIPDPKQISSKEDLLDMIQSLKEGIHHGVLEQKIFPKTDDAQFSKEKMMSQDQDKTLSKSTEDLLNKLQNDGIAGIVKVSATQAAELVEQYGAAQAQCLEINAIFTELDFGVGEKAIMSQLYKSTGEVHTAIESANKYVDGYIRTPENFIGGTEFVTDPKDMVTFKENQLQSKKNDIIQRSPSLQKLQQSLQHQKTNEHQNEL